MMGQTVEGEFGLLNQLGLHARAAAQLVKAANRFACEVFVECEGQKVNAKSIMGLLSLAAGVGMKLRVSCVGEGAEACLKEIEALILGRFGEPR
jgi:phosphocarrier protein